MRPSKLWKRARGAAEDVKSYASDAAGSAKVYATDVAEKAGGLAGDALGATGAYAGKAVDSANDWAGDASAAVTRRRQPSLAKGLLAGVAAGIVATLVMDQFQALMAAGQKAAEKHKKLAEGESQWDIAHEQAAQELQQQSEEGSTVKVAKKIAETAGTVIPGDQKQNAGQAVHYTFGTLMGVVYSATAEMLPEVTTGAGTAFGTLLFLGADEVAVPAFQLGSWPTETPARDQLQHWAAHLVYGGTLELARNVIRRLL